MSDLKESKPQTKLAAVRFVESVPFHGESLSVSASEDVKLSVARIDADGSSVAIDKGQRADGVLIKARTHDRLRNTFVAQQIFVPFANVKAILYGE